MEGEQQETLAPASPKQLAAAGQLPPVSESVIKDLEELEVLRDTFRQAKDRIKMLEHGMSLKTTTTQQIVKVNQDSIEIGEQKTGRVKAYGELGNKKAFAEKINNACELIEASRERIAKFNENSGNEKK